MRKILLLLLAVIILAPVLSAQDVITLKNGEEIQVKVTKVGDNEIEYKKWSNQNGPTYSKSISEIFMIKYENGEKEVYNKKNTLISEDEEYRGNYTKRISNNIMVLNDRDFVIDNHELSDDEVRSIFNIEDYEKYCTGRRKYVNGNLLKIPGIIMMGAGGLLGLVGIINGDSTFAWAAGFGTFIAGLAVGMTGGTIHNNGVSLLYDLVEKYNNGQTKTYSLSIQPSFLHGYHDNIATGICLTLGF